MEQPQYNLLDRGRFEKEYGPLYEKYGLGTTIWSPLASGALTGKYLEGIPEGSRASLAGYEWLKNSLVESDRGQERMRRVASLAPIAEKLNVSMSKLAIAWCLLNENVSTAEQTGELNELQEQLIQTDIKKKSDKDHKIYIDTARALMQDTGIKTKIIKQYLPIMNQYINKYLADMDFFVNFTLDEEFNETIKSRYRDEFNYHSFSEGEKLRIDLAILFTWREIAKLKNSTNTNLLILDEIFDSSLDSSGTDEFMRILYTTMDKENIFVISHKGDTLIDKFPRVMKFEKYKNFTRMAE